MTNESRRKDFLNKAKEADQLAEKAKDDQVRDSWRKIAQTYRELAKFT